MNIIFSEWENLHFYLVLVPAPWLSHISCPSVSNSDRVLPQNTGKLSSLIIISWPISTANSPKYMYLNKSVTLLPCRLTSSTSGSDWSRRSVLTSSSRRPRWGTGSCCTWWVRTLTRSSSKRLYTSWQESWATTTRTSTKHSYWVIPVPGYTAQEYHQIPSYILSCQLT